MNNARYKSILRTLYGAILSSRLSPTELKALAQELRHRRFPDELAYMIDTVVEQHIGDPSQNDLSDHRVEEAEALIRGRKVSKAVLTNILRSLGLRPSGTRETTRDMLERFMLEASENRVSKLIEVLSSDQTNDSFLTGIDKGRE